MKIGLAALALIAVSFLGFSYLQKEPRADRSWIPEQARTARAVIDDTITLTNVRDWTYDENGPLSQTWTERTVDPDSIVQVWFLLEPFSDLEAIGHTFLSFEFADGTVLSFSVEALREQGEEYSALRGQFREYELSYQWGTERDFVTRRLIYLDHPLRLYPLTLTPEEGALLFKALAKETNVLADHPRFYNTLSANCTNVLATLINAHFPGALPYDLSWNLTGLSDEYLMREGLITQTGTVEETKARYDLTPLRAAIKEASLEETFSRDLRSLVFE